MVLDENEQQALGEYRDFLLRRFPQQVERLILFGSKARGDSVASSDIDVLVILRKRTAPTREGFYPFGSADPTWREIVGTTFDLLMKYDVNISPTVIGFLSWNAGVRRLGSSGAMVFYNTLPLYGALLGYLFLGESIGPAHLLGGALIIGGGLWAARGRS